MLSLCVSLSVSEHVLAAAVPSDALAGAERAYVHELFAVARAGWHEAWVNGVRPALAILVRIDAASGRVAVEADADPGHTV